jgi:hypothetical protein
MHAIRAFADPLGVCNTCTSATALQRLQAIGMCSIQPRADLALPEETKPKCIEFFSRDDMCSGHFHPLDKTMVVILADVFLN